MNHFPYSVEVVLKNEGGYINNPQDPGGETKFGISKKTYPSLDIKTLSQDQAKEIYYQDYWLKNNLDKIDNPEVAAAALDTVVNHGRGPYLIQQALQKLGKGISIDGRIGPDTLSLINSTPPSLFLSALYDTRKAYYNGLIQSNPALNVYLKGWLSRIHPWKEPATGGFAALAALLLTAWYFLRKKKKVL